MPSIYWQLNDVAWLRAEYIDAGRTLDDLAGEIGCHDSTLRLHLARHGIRKHREIDEGWLRRQYVDRGRTQQNIADELGVNVHVVARARQRFGIPAPDRRRYDQLHDVGWLRQQLIAGLSHREIAEEIGCAKTAVTMALRRLG